MQDQSPAQQEPAGLAAQGQTPGLELNFSQLLEQQIASAIQPALDEFRQQMAQAMEQQAEVAPASGADGQGVRHEAPQRPGTQPPVQQPPVQQPASQSPAPHVAEQPPLSQVAQQVRAPQAPLAQPTEADAAAGQAIARPERLEAHVPGHPRLGALRPALQVVEHYGEQWLQSLLVAGLTALLTESTHAAIQQRAEHGLHTLLEKLFEAVPNGVSNQEIQDKTERMLQAILRESLDAVFAEGMLATVQQGGQQAIQESLNGNFGGALKGVEDTLKAMVEALMAVLRRRRQSVLRLLLALVLLALESSLAQSDKEK